jgi:tRNA-Thr(GGU) m(6)t(6)A37 methyltransferase TsaA
MSETYSIKPVGVIKRLNNTQNDVSALIPNAIIEVFPEYSKAILTIEQNSHLWILTWLHLARRDTLTVKPSRNNPGLPSFGVFGIRSPDRPNPIGMYLARLVKVENNFIYVTDIDAVDGTPVIDLKPYYENDIIFSPRTPNIKPVYREKLKKLFLKQAVAHHQEECPGLFMGIRMAILAEEILGHINSPDLGILVEGSPCLADTLQGLTRSRLANPPRFRFINSSSRAQSTWNKKGELLQLSALRRINCKDFWELPDCEIMKYSLP